MKPTRRIYFIYLVLLLLISAFAWHLLPQQVIRGDGFVYLLSKTQREFFGREFFYTGFELSAASFGWLFSRLYGIHMSLYWWSAYVIMLMTHVLFYWFAVTIFKKPFIAFVASLFFALNFFGNWDIYSTHCYCFVIERIIPVLLLLPAGVYLHRYLDKRKMRDGMTSLILYFLGIGVGHWSVFVTAFFLFYPIFYALFVYRRTKWAKTILLGIGYLAITVFFILIQRVHESGFGLKWTVQEFLLYPQKSHWPELMLRQLVHWTEYPILLRGDFYHSMIGQIYDSKRIKEIIPAIAVLYITVFVLVYRFARHRRALLLTSVIGTASLFFINPLFGQYDVAHQPGANRYLFYPNVLLSLFWASFIEMLMTRRQKVWYWLVAILVIGYTFINMKLIGESYVESMGHNLTTKKVYEYIQTHATLVPRGTLIVGPYDEIGVYEASFFTEQLKPRGVKVMSEYNTYPDTSMWQRTASESGQVVMLTYDESCGCIRENWIKGGRNK